MCHASRSEPVADSLNLIGKLQMLFVLLVIRKVGGRGCGDRRFPRGCGTAIG